MVVGDELLRERAARAARRDDISELWHALEAEHAWLARRRRRRD